MRDACIEARGQLGAIASLPHGFLGVIQVMAYLQVPLLAESSHWPLIFVCFCFILYRSLIWPGTH